MLINTHSHLYAEDFDNDRSEAIARAETASVGMILLPAIDNESYDRQEHLAESRPDLFRQMMGLHPTSIGVQVENALEEARRRLFSAPDKYIAIGEIGLDFYWDLTFRQQQIDALNKQIAWAKELEKPIVLHLRNGKDGNPGTNAYAEMFRILRQQGNETYKGIMHCFSGTIDDARRAVEAGFLLGIGGTLTYKKSTLPDIVSKIPLESIVLETDDPYLAPVPHRGRRNEPAFITLVADKVAEIKGISPDEVAAATTENAKRLFNIYLID